MEIGRRAFLSMASGAAIGAVFARWRDPAWAQSQEPNIEKWMADWMSAGRAPGGTLHVSRFVEPVYFLTKPIAWRPNPDQVGKFEPVDVPKGFVTDFATIPRVFWTMLRPDGEYTYAAIVHDYLYWTQTRTREVSDQIFRHSMEDFNVSPSVASVVHSAVRIRGGSYWDDVPKQKAKGEKRILRRFPEDPKVRWQDWKRRPDVFAS
jgi:hypothetical protein